MLLYLQALVFLIFTSVPSPSSPYPPAVLDSSAARVLLQDLNKFVRSFWSAPPRLRRTTFKNVIAQIERTAAQLALTLSQTLKCDCGAPGCERDANAMRRTLPWHRCEASLDGKGCNGKETEMMMCGKVRRPSRPLVSPSTVLRLICALSHDSSADPSDTALAVSARARSRRPRAADALPSGLRGSRLTQSLSPASVIALL